jgi:hypothetical protein
MNHDHELLIDEIGYANRADLRGPMPEFPALVSATGPSGVQGGKLVWT